MSQENLTITFFSASVFHFSSHTACARRAALPQHPPILRVLSSHWALTTAVTGVWTLHLVVTEPGQDVDSLTITCSTESLHKATLGPNFSGNRLDQRGPLPLELLQLWTVPGVVWPHQCRGTAAASASWGWPLAAWYHHYSQCRDQVHLRDTGG